MKITEDVLAVLLALFMDVLIAYLVGKYSPDFGVGNTIVIIMLVNIFLLLLLVYNYLKMSATEIVEMACRGEEVLLLAKNMQKGANTVSAIWAKMPYDKNLKRYFEGSISSGITIERFIDLIQIPIDDVLHHILSFWDRENYSFYFVSNLQFEMLLVNFEEAGFFWKPSEVPEQGYFALKTRKEDFRGVISRNFQSLSANSKKLKRNAQIKPDENLVRGELIKLKNELIAEETLRLQGE